MKKKIKDLTSEEADKICDQHFFGNCEDCPLSCERGCIYELMNEKVEVEINE